MHLLDRGRPTGLQPLIRSFSTLLRGSAQQLISSSLTQGTFVLISGRLGSVYGYRNILIVGAIWFVAWSVVNGFSTTFVFFNIARALSGVGGAMIMPNAVALISTTIPPGRLRNITVGFFGASAPIGSYLGAIWAGIFVKWASWKWIFFGL